MCNPILDILLKTQPHCSQSGCEIMRPHPAAHPINLFPGSTSLGIIPSVYLNVFCGNKGKMHLLLPRHVKKRQKSGRRKFCSNLKISQTCLVSVKVQFLCASFHSRVLKFLSQSQILNKGCGT